MSEVAFAPNAFVLVLPAAKFGRVRGHVVNIGAGGPAWVVLAEDGEEMVCLPHALVDCSRIEARGGAWRSNLVPTAGRA